MDFSNKTVGVEEQIIDLFAATFTASEGAEEGDLIGNLVSRLLSNTPHEDIYVFTSRDDGEIVGGAIFSRLIYADDPRSVFILSPMAVSNDRHGERDRAGSPEARFG